jgi:hypothetical protein
VIDFSPFLAALRSWVAAASGLAESAVLIENEPRPRVPPVWFELRIDRSIPEGSDRLYLATVDAETVEAVTGVRLLEVVIACDSFSQSPNLIALGFVEAVRARGLFGNKAKILRDACAAVVDFGEVVNADYQVDDRWISRFELRTRIRWTFDAKGAVPGDVASWIAETEIRGRFPPAHPEVNP